MLISCLKGTVQQLTGLQKLRQLGLHMAYMLALCSGRRKDSRVRNRGAVVAIHRACKSCTEGGNKIHSCVFCRAYHSDNRDKHSEGAPGCSHGKTHNGCNYKYKHRQQAEWQAGGVYKAGDEYTGADKLAADTTKAPGKNKN